MEIRLAKPWEKADIQNLWDYCFDDSSEYVDWFFNTRYKPDNTLVLFENNRICSALQLLPYNIALRDREMATSFLVGVSTWPEDRGKGHVSKLLFKSLETMRERGQWISILLPFNYNFYRKYGWETCYSYNLYSGDQQRFLKYVNKIEPRGKIRPIHLPQDLGALSECYSYYTRNLNGYIIRDNQDWDRILMDVRIDGGNGYIYEKGNETAGFVFLVNTHDDLSIRAICCKELKGYMEMLKFAVNHTNANKQILWIDRFGSSPVPNITEAGIDKHEKPFVMGRIVDIPKAFQDINISRDINIIIQVVDPLLEWNNQRFIFKSGSHGLLVSPTCRTPDFAIPVSTLSQLLWGYYTPQQAIGYGMIDIYSADKVKSLDDVFPDTIPYIYEDY